MPLPPPPRSVGTRPLPPDPGVGGGDDAPPPLPSRPGAGAKRPPPPPASNGQPASQGPDEYLEPDDWTSGAPSIPPKNFSPPSSDDEEYIEPEDPPQLPPPVPKSHPGGRHLPPPPDPEEQETYDALDEVIAEHDDFEQETYDECELRNAMSNEPLTADSVYEMDPEALPAPPSPIQDDLYEFVPEANEHASEPPRPPASMPPHRAGAPPPPAPVVPAPPSLPARPPVRVPEPDQEPEPVPERTQVVKKKVSGEGAVMLGISQADLGAKLSKLKRVTADPPPRQEPTVTEEPSSSASTVQDRIARFKNAEKGIKPILPVKPHVVVSPMSPTVKSPTSPKPAVKKSPPPVRKITPPPVRNITPPPPVIKSAPLPAYDPEEIYDDTASFMPDPLHREEWYHGEIERGEATGRLNTIGQDGTFLVRKSKGGGDNQPYTLVVLYKGHIYNLKVRTRSDGQVALGEMKSDELAFLDVIALVNHHKSHDVILVNVKENKQYKTLLKRFPISINGLTK